MWFYSLDELPDLALNKLLKQRGEKNHFLFLGSREFETMDVLMLIHMCTFVKENI